MNEILNIVVKGETDYYFNVACCCATLPFKNNIDTIILQYDSTVAFVIFSCVCAILMKLYTASRKFMFIFS